MRGDLLDRQWQVIRAIEAGSKGLAMFENAGPDETQGCGQNRNPIEACSKSWDRLFYYGALKRSVDNFLDGRA